MWETAGKLFIVAWQIGLALWYLREVMKLRAERKRLVKHHDEFVATLNQQVDSLRTEANELVHAYIARCKDWAADPWDPKWGDGQIFKDLDEKQKRTH